MDQSTVLYRQWTEHVTDPALAGELRAVAGNADEINERFYRTLSFGTAGLRGILGAGTNRMNIYTVGAATQGLCDYLSERGKPARVAIAYDSRHNSRLFAEHSARILAANGHHALLYPELMPTPALSFAIRHLKCDAGIVVTASHNPASYNGFKVYGDDASQISPEVADRILALINKIDYFSGIKLVSLEDGLQSGHIEYIGQDTVDAYLAAVLAEQIDPEACRKTPISVVYTPLNGTGNKCVRTVLERIGVDKVSVVPEQEMPDGDFPTCSYPNPEEASAMQLALDLAKTQGCDIVLATDPDADRAGVAVLHKGEYCRLTGNEIGVLLLRYIVQRRGEMGTLPKNPIAVKSVVSTKLADRLAKEMGVQMIDVLTGFKYIGEQIALLEEKGEVDRFVLGFEESSGYLSGPHARDKDAVNAVMLICEMTATYKSRGMTLIDVLEDIYRVCGRYLSVVDSYTFEGAQGDETMKKMLAALRADAPKEIAGHSVLSTGDYLTQRRTFADGASEHITLPVSNILEYSLEGGASVLVRPSGTEPKIKVYYSVVADNLENAQAVYDSVSAGVRKLLGL